MLKFRHALCLLVATSAVLVGCTSNIDPANLGATLTTTIQQALDAGPGRDSDRYVDPSEGDRTAIAAALVGLSEGKTVEPPPGYAITSEAGIVVLAEVPQDGHTNGWGMAAIRPSTSSKVVIQVPHPRADMDTEKIGSTVFVDSEAKALLIAGAHRTAGSGRADVAHNRDTVFAAMDAALIQPSWTVLQLHGFAESSHTTNIQVILSDSTGAKSSAVGVVERSLQNAGFSVCVYGNGGCATLGGTTNVEASHSRQVAANFVHIEIADSVREDPQQRSRLSAALVEATNAL